MEKLPVELKLEISKHLTDKDIASIRLLSRTFRKIYDEEKGELFWKDRFQKRFPGEENKKKEEETWKHAYQIRAAVPKVLKPLGEYLKESTGAKGYSSEKNSDRKYNFILDKPTVKRIFAGTVERKFPNEIKEFQSYFDNGTKNLYVIVTLK